MNFREHNPDQGTLFGLNISEKIPPKHMVRYVNDIIEQLDLSELYTRYSDEGTPAYHPKMMLKIIVYAYINGIYTCRKIAKAVRENINFIWLAGEQEPDFRTINTFAWTKCSDILIDVFYQVVLKASSLGYLDLDTCFVDGTTIHANAGKNSYIWKSNALRYQELVKTRVEGLFKKIEEYNQEEQQQYGTADLLELGEQLHAVESEKTATVASEQIRDRLVSAENKLKEAMSRLQKNHPSDTRAIKKIKSLLREISKSKSNDITKLEKYEQQLEIIGEGRSSTSKTDNDATFMRLKNGQLAPGYVASIGTSEQFVTGIHLFNIPKETVEFPNLMEQMHDELGQYPTDVVGDAAYGTALNLNYAAEKEITSYLKTQDYKRDYRDSLLTGFSYDEEHDEWVCQFNRRLVKIKEEETEKNGPKRIVKTYICNDCRECPHNKKCIPYKDKTHKLLTYDPHIAPLKRQTVNNLLSEKGDKLRKQRGIEPEAVFAFMKWNRKFERFTVRSLRKCKEQLSLLFLGHNIGKMFLHLQNTEGKA